MQTLSFGITRLTTATSPLLTVGFLGTLKTRAGEELKVRGLYNSFDKEETLVEVMEAIREEAIQGLQVVHGILPPSLKDQVQVTITGSRLSIGA